MKERMRRILLAGFGLFVFSASALAQTTQVFPDGSEWRYLLGTSEASTPTSLWRTLEFSDATWSSGITPLGYGETDIATTLPTSTAGNYMSVFCRKIFTVADPAAIAQLNLGLRIDDGAVAWLNGVEVGRDSVQAGELAFNTPATAQGEPHDVDLIINSQTLGAPLSSVLRAGNNVIAVHLFNGATSSSDIYLNADLAAVAFDSVPPVLVSVDPAPGPVIQLTEITVTFSEPVQGVNETDLLINGQPAVSMTGADASYTFYFPQPAFDLVNVAFNPNHGITDFGVPAPNAFDHTVPAGSWQYDLTDIFPPTVASADPAPGATVRSLTRIEVRFSEPVVGVDAADLLIAGVPATDLIAITPERYAFTFAEPSPGLINVAWAASTGIQDQADPANTFTGGSWQYTLDPTASAASLYITEFMAANQNVLVDEDGDAEDWIEIHNAGQVTADLAGWHLTDSAGDLEKWKFPETNLVAGGFMIVFASNKDRRTPGAPLHTNFRLSAGGEFLALVKPDGQTIASSYTLYPPQVTDVSYGLPTSSTPTTILTEGAALKIHVPTDGNLGLDWTMVGFDDGAWAAGANGVGFEGSSNSFPNLNGAFNTDITDLMWNQNSSVFIRIPFNVEDPADFDFLNLRMKYDDGYIAYLNGAEVARRNAFGVVANSMTEFSGVQGSNNWYYGLYNYTTDADKTYAASDFFQMPGGEGQGAWNAVSQNWSGSAWDLNTASAAPWTAITREGGHPNGNNSGDVHWIIRRYVSEASGTMTVRFHLAKQNTGGGNGVTGAIFHNGTQIYSRTIGGTDGVGVTTNVTLVGVTQGDFIDLALSPRGTDGTDADGSDGSLLDAEIIFEEGLFPDWNISATAIRPDQQAVVFENQDVSPGIVGLAAGQNILAIHGLNSAAGDNDFLIAAELETSQAGVLTEQPRYFANPTPGEPNGLGVDELGPVLSHLTHKPSQPLPGQDLLVTVQVTPTFYPVSSVNLHYRVMFGAVASVPMEDGGTGADRVAGDGVYSAWIPTTGVASGQMIRWYATATDSFGRISRDPLFESTLNSPEYEGTIIHVEQTNSLPILHLFTSNFAAAGTDGGTRCSIYYEGEFYDNLYINLHGQSSRGFVKKSYDVDFHPGHNFRWNKDEIRVDDINLMTTWPDKAFMRNILAYNTYRNAGSTYHFVVPVRVHNNGSFEGVWHLMENGDDNWLERLGLDPNGALYKMYATFTDLSHANPGNNVNAEKKTRKLEDTQDLKDLYNGIVGGTDTTRTNYMFDNIDIPATINYLAARIITGDRDCCHKNYYFYRDTEGNGEWMGMPWDVDLSFGRNWTSAENYFDTTLSWNNALELGNNNGFFQKMFYNTGAWRLTRQMYYRRIRTLMDELVQPSNTPASDLRYEREFDQLFEVLRADAALDLAKWGTWIDAGNGSATFDPNHVDHETLAEAITRMKVEYMNPRRAAMYNRDAAIGNSANIPDSQPADTVINFGTIEYNPGTGNQAHEYLELINTNNIAVDISDWQLAGAIQHTFKPGTVIPIGGRLYVSPDVRAFRSRPFSPTANEGRFVQGNYSGQLSARGEMIQLVHKDGRVLQSKTYEGNPSPAQQSLRITEIMYHPADVRPGENFTREDYEYLELKNIGPVSLDLTGVHFTNGVDFTFTGAAVTSLAPGQTVMLVKNPAAFAERYGAGSLMVGPYNGFLDNGGERIRLDDADGEKVLDFSYRDGWYPITDGLGFSLVIVDETMPFQNWDLKASWRPSGRVDGSPGADDPAPVVVAPILVNEALTHTDLPQVDTIELHNPGTNNVNIGGWFLSDDFYTPYKFRVPDNTIVPAGGYVLFTENDFNFPTNAPTSFSLSSHGDEVYLFSGDGTELTGYFHGFDFEAAENGVTFGRYLTSQGQEHFVAMSSPTLPGPNSLPKVGPVVISEMMYHPPDLAGGEDNEADEFIELHNITGVPVALYDPAAPTNTWLLDGAVEFRFPANVTLAAGGYALVVSFDPYETDLLEAFRDLYNVPFGVAIYGPYEGKLSNDEEKIKLYKPDSPEPDLVPYVLVDRVDYEDFDPWPFAADGFGPSLVRNQDAEYGNDPANWRGAAPSAGRASAGGLPPQILTQPADVAGVMSQDVTFSVEATGTAPLQYQWRFNGDNLPGANQAVLTLEDIRLSQAGLYNVAVFNGAGAVVSSNAQLQVLIPAAILAQPVSQMVRQGSNAVFSVSASSSSAITYQWRKDGINLLNQTNASLTLLNVQESDSGIYSVLITDDVGTIESDQVSLLVLVMPAFVTVQTNYVVIQGRDLTMSAETSGTLPMGYRWRKSFATLTNQVLMSHKSFYTLRNVQPTDVTSPYTIVITNAAFFTPGILSQIIRITLLTDTDGDGLPDNYETAHGLNPNDPGDAGLDGDGDGMTNGEEYIAGTDPEDGNSYLKIEALSVSDGVNVQFMAVAGRNYSIEYTDALGNPVWTKLEDVVSSDVDRPVSVNDPSGSTSRYYRLVTPHVE